MSKAVSKRALREMEIMVLRHSSGDYDSSIFQAPPKRRKYVEHGKHKVQNSENCSCKPDGGGGSYNWIVYNYIKWYGSPSISIKCYEAEYTVKFIIRISIFIPYPVLVAIKHEAILSLSTILDILKALRNFPGHRCLPMRMRIEDAPGIRVEESSKTAGVTGWDSLPCDLQENILQRGDFGDLFRFKTSSKSWKKLIDSEDFSKLRGATSSREGSFTVINYYIKNKAWRCTGFDLQSKTWRAFPPISPTLPAPDVDLFKEYSVCGHGGLMCADVAKLPKKGQLVVFNPLTRKTFALPPLLNPRSPVLVHILVCSETKSYKVIAAGSSSASDQHRSKKIEVFDSKTSMWEDAPDVPGPAFGLNDYHTGVCIDGVLYLIAFLEGDCRRGVIAFDVVNKKWLDNKGFPIPFSMYANTLQLVETNGNVCLFSEQEQGGSVDHCIDVLEISNLKSGEVMYRWRNVIRVKKSGGRGLQVYPEHICVPFGEGKLCVFNTLNRDGVVYNMQDGREVDVLKPPPLGQKGDKFFSLNPTSFTLQPSFDIDPTPQCSSGD